MTNKHEPERNPVDAVTRLRPFALPLVSALAICFGLHLTLRAQAPSAHPPVAYPDRPPAAKDVVERGKAQYSVSCSFCHGSDAGGGVGPNLLRSQVVLDDQNGELITPIVHGARADRGMPPVELRDAQIADIAAFLHSLHVTSHAENQDINIVVGDPKAGEAYFQKKCAGCHSAAGDLKAIGARIPDAKILQQTWLLPGGPGGRRSVPPPASYGLHIQPATVTVTLASGEKVEGKLVRIDDFYVGLTESDGTSRGFRRDGDQPAVEIHDPVAPHKALLKIYNDQDIHNVTAYLVTLK